MGKKSNSKQVNEKELITGLSSLYKRFRQLDNADISVSGLDISVFDLDISPAIITNDDLVSLLNQHVGNTSQTLDVVNALRLAVDQLSSTVDDLEYCSHRLDDKAFALVVERRLNFGEGDGTFFSAFLESLHGARGQLWEFVRAAAKQKLKTKALRRGAAKNSMTMLSTGLEAVHLATAISSIALPALPVGAAALSTASGVLGKLGSPVKKALESYEERKFSMPCRVVDAIVRSNGAVLKQVVKVQKVAERIKARVDSKLMMATEVVIDGVDVVRQDVKDVRRLVVKLRVMLGKLGRELDECREEMNKGCDDVVELIRGDGSDGVSCFGIL